MNILLIKKAKADSQGISVILELDFGVKVKAFTAPRDAIQFLSTSTVHFETVILDDEPDNEILLNHIKTLSPTPKCILIKNVQTPLTLKPAPLEHQIINSEKAIDELKIYFTKILKTNFSPENGGSDDLYVQLRATTAIKGSPLKLDLYQRLSSQEYILFAKKGDSLNPEVMGHFLLKNNIDSLYCLKKDAHDLVLALKEITKAPATQNQDTTAEEMDQVALVQEAVLELGERIGYTPEVQELAKQGMLKTIKTITTGTPKLGQIIKSLLAERKNYKGGHAILTAQIACSLAKLLGWSSGSTVQKLVFAAFFHDMILTNAELVKIKDLNELTLRRSEFTEDEFKKYKVHPNAVAQIISTFSEVPTDVDTIIAQHHEKPDGSGFPRGLSGQHIAPLATIFIIAHDIVDYLFDNGLMGVDDFFFNYRNKYSDGYFRKILKQIDLGKIDLDV